MKRQNQYRQGDVLLEQVNEIPPSEVIKDRVLAHGETSGHGHIVIGEATIHKTKSGELHIDTEEGVKLEHLLVGTGVWTKEHYPVQLPAGKYRVIQQREYDPYADLIRDVLD